MCPKVRTVFRETSVSPRSKKFRSLLSDVIAITSEGELSGIDLAEHNKGYDPDYLSNEVKNFVLNFLKERGVPYEKGGLPYPEGELGIVGIVPDWRNQYDHIPGVRVACHILFDLNCFHRFREENPEKAYGHLFRIIELCPLLTTANMEARHFSGTARAGSGKQSEKEDRKQRLINEYCVLREEGKINIYARQFAAKRIGVSLSTAKRYFNLDQLEEACLENCINNSPDTPNL